MQSRATKWIILLIVFLNLVIGTNTAFAETAKLEIIRQDINVMPEYDTPDILLIYSVHFKNNSDQPYSGEFVWNLPNSATKYTVVDQSKGDNHIETTVKHGEKNDQIVWKFPTPLQPGEIKPVHIEYYYNNLQGNPDKTFVYDYIPEYPIAQAEVLVYQPKKASNMVVTPDFGQAQPGNGGFSTYKKEFKNLKSGDNVQLKVSYTKSDPNPSVAPPSQQQSEPSTGQPQQSKRTSAAIVLLFLAAFVAVLGLIIYKAMNSKPHSGNLDEEEFDYDDERMINPQDKPKKQSLSKQQQSKGNSKLQADKKKLRDALISCRITEDTYYQLLAELNEEEDQ